jgi:hypothetical protein
MSEKMMLHEFQFYRNSTLGLRGLRGLRGVTRRWREIAWFCA